MNLKDLALPVTNDMVEWRVGQCGKGGKGVWVKVLCYITNRAIMNRLDDVCGPENWQNMYQEWHGTSQICGIGIKCGAEWIWKWDGADITNIEATKGGLSDSMKRAGVQWGIGRELYKLKETWAEVSMDKQYGDGWHYQKAKGNEYPAFYWKEPTLNGAKTTRPPKTAPQAPQQPIAPEPEYEGMTAEEIAQDMLDGAGERMNDPIPGEGYNDIPDSGPGPDVPKISEKQVKMIYVKCKILGIDPEDIKAKYSVESLNDIPKKDASTIIDRLIKREAKKNGA